MKLAEIHRRSAFVKMTTIIPPGISGDVEIQHFTVSRQDSNRTSLRAVITGHGDAFVPTGRYLRMLVGKDKKWNGAMMSDTPAEQRTNFEFLYRAEAAGGDILIAGLGIGMILLPALQLDAVDRIDVIENNSGVITLVEPYLQKALLERDANKLHVIKADIFDFKPAKGERWDVIYFDIWQDRCTDNLEGITRLKRKFARRLKRENKNAWMGAWIEDELRYLRRQERRQGW